MCQREGIEVSPDWSPSDAWEALAGKGITPSSVYQNLKVGAKKIAKRSIPKSAKTLDGFDDYREKAIEKTPLANLSDKDKAAMEEVLKDLFENCDYRMTRGTKSFGDIMLTGCKSQMETKRAGRGAAFNERARKATSKVLTGHQKVGDSEYEKIGYLAPKDDAEDFADKGHPNYGDMVLTFKKGNMKDRTTYTYGDSLDKTGEGLKSAGWAGENPTIEGMSSLGKEYERRRKYPFEYEVQLTGPYKKFKDGKISRKEMFDQIRDEADMGYFELQFHGPVIPEDIEKVVWKSESALKESFDNMSDSKRGKVIESLKKNGTKLLYREGEESPFVDAWEWIKKRYPNNLDSRMDAPEGENNNQNSGGTGGGGGGNTRLPFGLCMRYGIPIEKSWGPGDAWEALKSKGITSGGAYKKLKAGGDPGTPEVPPPKKDPVKKIRMRTYGGESDYNKLEGRKISWASRGEAPWRLYGDRVEGTYEDKGWRSPPKRMSEAFFTKTDM